MALIELNLEKPALKRTELVEGAPDETETEETTDLDVEVESEEPADLESLDESEESSGDIAGTARKAALVGALVSLALLARRIRSWRKGSESTADVETDW